MASFKVVGCNVNQKGKFVVKVQKKETVKTVFGALEKSETYYKGNVPQKMKEGAVIELNLDEWNIVSRPFTIPETGEIIELKWLHLK